MISILKTRKSYASKNEEFASRSELTAQDFVESLDILMQESKNEQNAVDDAVRLAEKIVKNDCIDDFGTNQSSYSKEGVFAGFLSSAKVGLASANHKYNDVQEIIKTKLVKLNLTSCLDGTGFFMS